MSRYSDMCKEVVDVLLDAGFVVYLAASGEYGFFTDAEEKVIVSFGTFGLNAHFTGNYIATALGQGTGWGIGDVYPLNAERAAEVFREAHCPPRWATGGNPVKLASAEHHLKTFPASGFKKVVREGEQNAT